MQSAGVLATESFGHGFGQSTYHMIWRTKYCYKVLRSEHVNFPKFSQMVSQRASWGIGKIFRSISDVQQEVMENYIRRHRSYR